MLTSLPANLFLPGRSLDYATLVFVAADHSGVIDDCCSDLSWNRLTSLPEAVFEKFGELLTLLVVLVSSVVS